jgi:hypothetical protein
VVIIFVLEKFIELFENQKKVMNFCPEKSVYIKLFNFREFTRPLSGLFMNSGSKNMQTKMIPFSQILLWKGQSGKKPIYLSHKEL